MKLSFIDNIKKKLNEKKKKKQKERELIKKMEEEEKAIEAELPKEEKTGVKEIIQLLKGPDEEELEYQSYLTEEELQEEQKSKKAEKKMTIIAGSIFVSITILVVIGSNIFYNTFKSDLLKVTQPMMEKYYKNRYGTKVKITNIEELTYRDPANYQEVKTDIYLATTDDDKHIISVNNELIGDDISTQKISNEILDYIDTNAPTTEIINHSIELSYVDYYKKFNRYLDYINALPYKSSEELINSKKLTVTYKNIYQNDINFDEYLNIIDNFSDDSVFYLVKHEMGLPVNLTVIKKGEIKSINVTSETIKDEGITHIELDRALNDVSLIDIAIIGDGSMQAKDNHLLTNGLYIKAERQRSNRDEEEKEKYIMVKFNKIYSPKTVVQLSSGDYQELDKSNYKDIIFIEAGSQTYIISEEDYAIATKTTKKKGFLCNFGLC